MDRRLALKALSLTAPVALGAACQSSTAPEKTAPRAPLLPSFAPTLLSVEQALVLEAATERLLPETTTPGATRCRVGPFIEEQLRDVYDLPTQRAFLDGLDALDRAAVAAHGQAFPLCSEERQLGLLDALAKAVANQPPPKEGEPQPFLLELRGLAVWAMCSSQLGATTILQYDPVPGAFQGCVPLAEVGKAWAT